MSENLIFLTGGHLAPITPASSCVPYQPLSALVPIKNIWNNNKVPNNFF